MKISLGFSPCPNDCFMFEAIASQRLDTAGIEFDIIMEDVETLNRLAASGSVMVSKLSLYALAMCLDRYLLLRAGAALGSGVGPLLIAKEGMAPDVFEGRDPVVALPGRMTTAHFLFSMRFPKVSRKEFMLFSEIENAVTKGKADAGVIIHENRFTYERKGLKKILDLGEWWEEHTSFPIPLGGIVAKRSLPRELLLKVEDIIRQSVRFAFANRAQVMPFVREHAAEMDEDVMQKHIDLYVNSYSIDLGPGGRKSVEAMFAMAKKEGMTGVVPPDILLE